MFRNVVYKGIQRSFPESGGGFNTDSHGVTASSDAADASKNDNTRSVKRQRTEIAKPKYVYIPYHGINKVIKEAYEHTAGDELSVSSAQCVALVDIIYRMIGRLDEQTAVDEYLKNLHFKAYNVQLESSVGPTENALSVEPHRDDTTPQTFLKIMEYLRQPDSQLRALIN